MRVPRHNWETQQLEYPEYPEALFEPLVVYLLTTNAWRDDPQRVQDKVLTLQRALAAYQRPPDSHHETDTPLAAVPSPAEALAAKRRANLEKARAVRKAKREAVHAEA